MLETSSLLSIVFVGLAAGILASFAVPASLDLIGSMVVGVIGAAIGSYLFPGLGAHVSSNPAIATIITATAGAILLLLILRLVRR